MDIWCWRALGAHTERGVGMYLSVGVDVLWTLFLFCACGVATTAVTCVGKTSALNQIGKSQNLPVLQ